MNSVAAIKGVKTKGSKLRAQKEITSNPYFVRLGTPHRSDIKTNMKINRSPTIDSTGSL